MKDKILQIIKNKPKHFSTIIKKSPELYHWVIANSGIRTSNFAEMIYSAVHGITNICQIGNTKKFNSFNEGYRFCGPASRCECALKSVKIRVSRAKQNYTEQQRQQISQQRQQTTLERYGVVNNGQTKNARLRHQEYYHNKTRKPKPTKTSSYQRLNKKYQSMADVVFVTPEDQYKGVSHHQYYQFRCLICNNNFDDYIDNGHLPKCLSCHPYVPNYTSKQETEVLDYIKTIANSPVLQSNKSIINPYELDIVIPDLKIAIEYCGLYWHSEAHKTDKNYHLNKMNLCNQKGYRLITIFEDEWVKTPDIVKSRLKNILGTDRRIYARHCQVRVISYDQAREFVSTYHMQGNAICKIAYGCFLDNELVAVMTFGIPRYDKTAEYELIRYCSQGTVIGGAGKLFSKFVKDHDPKSVISYCDMRWGSGNLYRQLNFAQVEHKQQPSYSYTDFVNRYHRSSFTKKKIAVSQDKHKTEYQIMRERNMYRIWDCGQTKWLYNT
jgi:hypothetical protein